MSADDWDICPRCLSASVTEDAWVEKREIKYLPWERVEAQKSEDCGGG